MNLSKALTVNGQAVGGGKEPLVCAPLVAKTEETALVELAAVVAKKPDLLEWRVDFFEGIGDVSRVVALARRLKQGAAGIPIIFTRRSTREGGEQIGISEEQVLEIYKAVCESRSVDFVDWELSSDPAYFQAALSAAHLGGAQLIASFHNFKETPPAEELVAKFVAMQKAGADIAKIAVMPKTVDDVLTLLGATLEANRQTALPIISMSMGGYGSLSRLIGWAFGSSVTFAVGAKASAPGQVPIEDMRVVLDVVQRAFAPK